MNANIARGIGILLSLYLFVGGLALAALSVGQSEAYYAAHFTQDEVLETAGVSEADALRLARGFAAYLRGDARALDLEVAVFGVPQAAFHEREIQHMQDVRGLFALAERLMLFCLILFTALVGLLLLLRPKVPLRTVWRWGLGALCALFLVVLVICCWTLIDFSSLFVLFHRLSFSNDLWQMDPATDLMIRLMPQSMFAQGALSILWRWILCLALYASGLWIYAFGKRRVRP